MRLFGQRLPRSNCLSQGEYRPGDVLPVISAKLSPGHPVDELGIDCSASQTQRCLGWGEHWAEVEAQRQV